MSTTRMTVLASGRQFLLPYGMVRGRTCREFGRMRRATAQQPYVGRSLRAGQEVPGKIRPYLVDGHHAHQQRVALRATRCTRPQVNHRQELFHLFPRFPKACTARHRELPPTRMPPRPGTRRALTQTASRPASCPCPRTSRSHPCHSSLRCQMITQLDLSP